MERDYNTHLDVLKFVCKMFPVKTVVEYGAGRYSTQLFHNLGLNYVSYEDDKRWIKKLPHLNIEYARKMPYKTADLIFIDNGKTFEDRIKVIKMHKKSHLVIIHDWDFREYREAVEWDFVLADDKFPQTAICINY
jgi:hypothetical protein